MTDENGEPRWGFITLAAAVMLVVTMGVRPIREPVVDRKLMPA
jgi:negative regulator of sigma E activity